MKMKGLMALWFLLCFLIGKSIAQAKSAQNEYSFLFYNTENFFDTENDSLTRDEEFTSEGDRRWTPGRMHAKAERLGKVILAAGKWNAPVFVGLCEVENLMALELITGLAPINNYHYQIVQKDSPDERGIDVAFLYRPELFHPLFYQAIPVIDPDDKSFHTRDILQICGVLNGCDTLHLFVNHWPSRYGGMMETQRLRWLAAETLKTAIHGLRAKYPKPKIICMGDFNDNPNDESLANVLEAREVDHPQIAGEMINLSAQWLKRPIKTIKHQYDWEAFDQFIVSDYFLRKNECYEFLYAEIFDAGFLLEPDPKFGGVKPKRTYVGYKYQEGFSDHLPVFLRIKFPDH